MGEKRQKAINFEIKEIDDNERSFLAIASTEDIDRDNDRIMADGWILDNFLKNPVIPWAHRYSDPPVAKSIETYVKDKRLMFRPKFATRDEYPFADIIYKLYRGGYLNTFSVGFNSMRYEIVERAKGVRGYDFLEQELWEISACTVPSNPNALIEARKKGLIDDEDVVLLQKYQEQKEEKGICGSRDLPVDDRSGWDAKAAEGRIRRWAGGPDKEDIDWNKYKKCYVWRDEEKKETFEGYKLPFADIINDKATATWGGVHTAMGVVLGAMGGVDIPEDDRKKAYNFLASYYKKFEKPVPDYKTNEKRLAIEKRLDDMETMLEKITKDPTAWIEDAIKERRLSERLDDMEKKLDAVIGQLEALAASRDPEPEPARHQAPEAETRKPETPSLQKEQVADIVIEVMDRMGEKIGNAIDKRIKYHLGRVD